MGRCGSAVDDTTNVQPKETKPAAPAQQTDPELLNNLKTVPLCAKFNDKDRQTLANHLTNKFFSPDTTIMSDKENAQFLYIIKDGKVRLLTPGHRDPITLGKGDYFGDTSLVQSSAEVRSGTAVALDFVSLYMIEIKKFKEMFEKQQGKRAAVSAESYNPDKASRVVAPPDAVRTKTPEQKAAILNGVKETLLFKHLGVEQQSSIIDEMWLMDVPAGTSIIKQGEMGDNFYVVESGQFDIYITKDGNTFKVASKGPGSLFGELALLYNAPRAATVTAVGECKVWAVDRWTFRRIVTKQSDQKLKEYEQFLSQVPSFEVLLEHERAKLAEAMEEHEYEDGQNIITQGEQGDTFYILKKGSVVVTITKDGVSTEVARYKHGDFFGERSLVKNEERAATVTAIGGPAVCLSLNREAFSLLLGSMEDIFKQRVDGYNAEKGSSAQSPSMSTSRLGHTAQPEKEENYLRKDIKLEDLQVLGTLGKGSFGHVQLVKHKAESKTYALKCVSKTQIVQLKQQDHIMSEKRVMAQLDCPFLIKLYATFNQPNSLYFLLEPSLGGELFSVLRAKTFFDETTAKFYAAGVIVAFEYMHSKGIIYRDLKPENILLDAKGYVKVTDFGFAKKVGDNRTWTLCGTPDYLAPEVVSGQGHGKGVDWWTLGILIYEMLASYPPFYDEDPMKTYSKIMQGTVNFPMHFSKPAVDIIKKLLHPKATKRLGVTAGGAKQIKDHAWFSGFDWKAFEARTGPAPIVLPVKNDEDLSNFEEYPDEDNTIEDYVPDEENPNWDADF